MYRKPLPETVRHRAAVSIGSIPHSRDRTMIKYNALLLLFAAFFLLQPSSPALAGKADPSGRSALQSVGVVDFTISCAPEVQSTFNQSVAMLHHMMYEQSRALFTELAADHPQCAMLQWGLAMTHLHPLWAPPSQDDLLKGAKAVDQAVQLGASTQREQDYIDAIRAFYSDWQNLKHGERIARWEAAQEQLFMAYPDDIDATAFYALAHLATATKADKTFMHQKKAGEILEQLHGKAPQHPAGYHYLIHAYDNPALAHKAVDIARGYGTIAPEVPHALHMPTHIFVRLGLWDDVIEWNQWSAEAAWKQPVNGSVSLHYAHAIDYLVYGYLQKGNDSKALEALDKLNGVNDFQNSFASAYAIAAAQARFPLERAKWQEAAALKTRSHGSFPWDKYPWFESITYFARGIGAARSGDAPAARDSLKVLDAYYRQTLDAGQDYWAVLVDSQRKSVAAWAALAEGSREQAVAMMEQAADLEDSVDKHPVTPGAVLPARELLGDMLLELEQYEQARQAYESALKISANRLRSLYGAGRAAELAGLESIAQAHYATVVDLAAASSTDREELKQAEAFVER